MNQVLIELLIEHFRPSSRSILRSLFSSSISSLSYPPSLLLFLVSPPLNSLSRSARIQLSRLRCNRHSLLASYRSRIGLSSSSNCDHCGNSLADLSHLILSCPFFVRRPLYLGLFPSLSSLFFHPTAVCKMLGLGAAQVVPAYSAERSGVG